MFHNVTKMYKVTHTKLFKVNSSCTKLLIQSYSKLTQDKLSNMKAGEKIRSDTEVVAVI